MLEEQRSMMRFDGAIKATETRRKYTFYLNKFLEFAKMKEADGLLQLQDRHLETIIEDYVLHMRKKVSPNSIPIMFAPIELFFVMNDKNLNFKRIRKLFPQTVKKAGFEAWTTDQVKRILGAAGTLRNKALILFLCSTGCRVGAIPGLRVKHITGILHDCKSVLFYEGEKEEYYGFLTPEASQALNEYLEKRKADREYLDDNSPLFRQTYQVGSLKPKAINAGSIENVVRQLIKKAGVTRQKFGNNYTVQTIHGFRKWFATTIKLNKNISYSTGEALLGHKSGLEGAYYKPDFKTQLIEEFQKAIPDLTIDQTEKLRLENQKQKEEISEKELLKGELDKVKADLQSMKFSYASWMKIIRHPDVMAFLEAGPKKKNIKQTSH